MNVPLVPRPVRLPLAGPWERFTRTQRSGHLVDRVAVGLTHQVLDAPHAAELGMNAFASKIVLEAPTPVALLRKRRELPPVAGHARAGVVDGTTDLREPGMHDPTRSA